MSTIEGDILFNPREGMQTPPETVGRLDNPGLPPPCQLVVSEVTRLFAELPERSDLLVELPTPVSCPSAAKQVSSLLTEARELGVADRTPVHIMMTELDFRLAIACGAQAVHMFGNSSTVAGNGGKPPDELLENLTCIADIAYASDVKNLRASLEHAPNTQLKAIALFLMGIRKINSGYDRRVITAVGFPDTNGVATFDNYEKILAIVRDVEPSLGVFVHLHDDGRQALDTARKIMEFGREQGIRIVIETVLDAYPGERVGLAPTVSQLAQLGFALPLPGNVNDVLKGASWVLAQDGVMEERRLGALNTHTAGVHTRHMERYTNGDTPGHPSPGVYTIMGKNNIGYWQEHVLGVTPSDQRVLGAAALVGREYAAQDGNKPQAYAIALARLTSINPELVTNVADSFGPPDGWLGRPLPDVQIVSCELERIIREKWGSITF